MIGNIPGFYPLDASGTHSQCGEPTMPPTLPNVPCRQSHLPVEATALRDRLQLGESGGGTCSWNCQLLVLLQFLRAGELAALCSCFVLVPIL